MSSAYLENPEEAKELQPRLKLLYAVVFIASVLIAGRLWFLQIIEGTELRRFSERNRVKETKLPAPRGLILDRNGEVLVENLPGFEATISPQYATRLEETAKAMAPILNLSVQHIIDEVRTSRRRNGPFRPVRIKDNLNLNEVYQLKMLRWDHPGLNINETIVRYYPLEFNGAQALGYVGEISREQLRIFNERHAGEFVFEQGDIIGKSGLEEVWDTTIRGMDGISFVEVDARGREAQTDTPSFLGFKPRQPIPGKNLVLTLDKDVQMAAFEAMHRDDHIGPRNGALVAMKSNGEIIAWVNTPSFDPNEFSIRISGDLWRKLINDPFRPLRNKVIQDHYSPGSTLKPIIALAALQENIITANTIIHAPGYLRFGRRNYHDHQRAGHGHINVAESLERSSNVFYYRMGISLGIDRMADYARLLGIGSRTNIRLNNEVPGLMPDSNWKLRTLGEEWQPGENLSNAIGQGFVLTTPLQMALAYNIIGLEGLVYEPFIVKKIIDQDSQTVKEFAPKLLRDISQPEKEGAPYIDKKNFKIVKEGMWRVANGERGTARWWKIPGVEMAGKTGTSQVMSLSTDQVYMKCNEKPIFQRHHGWYIAYAPADKPEITVAVLAEHACAGSSGAAPIVRDVIKAYFEKYHPEKIQQPGKRRVLGQAQELAPNLQDLSE